MNLFFALLDFFNHFQSGHRFGSDTGVGPIGIGVGPIGIGVGPIG